MKKKQVSILTSVVALSAVAFTYTQCGRSAHLFYSSNEEKKALEQPVFIFPDNGPDTDVVDGDTDWDGTDPSADGADSVTPSNPYKNPQEPFKWVTSCNDLESAKNDAARIEYIQKVAGETGIVPGVAPHESVNSSRDFELAVVKKLVEDRIKAIKAGQKLPLLIPVEFTFSTGDKHDKVSYMAYRRSILRNDHDGKSYLTTPKQTYVVDHELARTHFIEGRFKYFGYVEVKQVLTNGSGAFSDFAKNQPFDTWSAYNMHLQGSGLKNVHDYVAHYDTKKELPVARLFLADIRDNIVPTTVKLNSMYTDVSAVGRNNEVTRRIKDIFNMKDMFQHKDLLTHAFALDRKVTDQNFTANYAGYAGMPQLMHKMNCDIGSTSTMAAQYTPIVLDLGSPYIRTSSEYWGTFFNLADAQVMENETALEQSGDNTFTHRTARVGGYLKRVPNPAISNLKPADTPVPFKEVWQRVAEDGFLILPNADANKPLSAANLFGAAFKNPEKPNEEYEDGFVALQDYAGTKEACAIPMPTLSYNGQPTDEQLAGRIEEIKKRYLGPWNEKFYSLRVWVDSDRDGKAQSSEVKPLIESGIMAMNTCLTPVSEVDERDQFGNNTKLRSAFLYNKTLVSGATLTDNEMKEILRTLALGKNSSGEEGNFRLMVDIFFKARPFHFLERSFAYRGSKDGKKYKVKIKDNVYEEDDATIPLTFD